VGLKSLKSLNLTNVYPNNNKNKNNKKNNKVKSKPLELRSRVKNYRVRNRESESMATLGVRTTISDIHFKSDIALTTITKYWCSLDLLLSRTID
jgi:hypothetical protein